MVQARLIAKLKMRTLWRAREAVSESGGAAAQFGGVRGRSAVARNDRRRRTEQLLPQPCPSRDSCNKPLISLE
jgi:hypothetical protein